MPNRYVREAAIESPAVNSLSVEAEVFWRRLLNRVDDYGRFTANPALLRASVFPLQLKEYSEARVMALLQECVCAGLIFVYEAEYKSILVMNKWENGRAKQSKYPPPPADVCEQMRTYVYGRTQIADTRQQTDDTCKQTDDACVQTETNGISLNTYAPDSDSDSDTDSDTDTGEDEKEQQQQEVIFTYPTEGKITKWHLRRWKIEEYQRTFPTLDVHALCAEALQWCRDNPLKRKTANGMPRFLFGWISKRMREDPPVRDLVLHGEPIARLPEGAKL